MISILSGTSFGLGQASMVGAAVVGVEDGMEDTEGEVERTMEGADEGESVMLLVAVVSVSLDIGVVVVVLVIGDRGLVIVSFLGVIFKEGED